MLILLKISHIFKSSFCGIYFVYINYNIAINIIEIKLLVMVEKNNFPVNQNYKGS